MNNSRAMEHETSSHSTQLSAQETADLDRIEAELEKDYPSVLRFGTNLIEIRDRKLYRRNFTTFEAYCQVQWGFKRQWVDQQIRSAKVLLTLPEKIAVPETKAIALAENQRSDSAPNFVQMDDLKESHARALSTVPQEKRVEVIQHAAAKPEPLTAASIKRSASALLDHSTARPEADIDRKYVDNIGRCVDDSGILDATGWDIPYWLVPVMDKTSEFSKKIVRDISTVKSGITTIMEHREEHPEFGECRDLQKYQIELEECYADLKRSIPYAVCLWCLGKRTTQCLVCHQNGWISEFAWKHSSTDMKEIRAKSILDIARKVA